MKSKYLFGLLGVLMCGFYVAAQQPDISDPLSQQPMTVVERQLLKMADLSDVQQMYDTLKTENERRNFIHALRLYFTTKNITSIPPWVENAVLTELTSQNAFDVAEAVKTAGTLKINCGAALMDLYRAVPARYGSNEELLKSYVIRSLSRIGDPGNHQFFYEVLTTDRMPLLSAQFDALLDAIDENRKIDSKSIAFDTKLAEYSAKLSSFKTRIDESKNPGDFGKRAGEMLKKIQHLRDGIAKDQAPLLKGGVK